MGEAPVGLQEKRLSTACLGSKRVLEALQWRREGGRRAGQLGFIAKSDRGSPELIVITSCLVIARKGVGCKGRGAGGPGRTERSSSANHSLDLAENSRAASREMETKSCRENERGWNYPLFGSLLIRERGQPHRCP